MGRAKLLSLLGFRHSRIWDVDVDVDVGECRRRWVTSLPPLRRWCPPQTDRLTGREKRRGQATCNTERTPRPSLGLGLFFVRRPC